MDFISTLLVNLSKPSGMWEKILDAFKNGTGTYIVAVILIAIIVRVLFSVVDIFNKRVTMKNSDLNEKMKPELDAVQKRYGKDPKVLQQKQQEIYKKYNFNIVGSCLPMLISMILQFVVFLTLWTGLQNVANFNIVEQYENMKSVYVSVIELNEYTPFEALKNELSEDMVYGEDYNFDVEINLKAKTPVLKITLFVGDENVGMITKNIDKLGLEDTYELLVQYVKQPKQEEAPQESDPETSTELVKMLEEGSQEDQEEDVVYIGTWISPVIKKLAEDAAEKYYLSSRESFLWIKNVYIADSPTKSPLFTKKEIKNYLSKYYTKSEKALIKKYSKNKIDLEGEIYKAVVTSGIGQKDLGKNGLYLLTVIAILISCLSTWLSNFLMKGKKKNQPTNQKTSWLMYVLLPVIFGIFTLMYTALFAIYIIVGQLVMMALSPLVTLIVKKWLAHDANKKKAKEEVVVDYRRK